MSTAQPPVEEGGSLGTFGGVFTPTLLTILGVIMYLRLGWVIGNGGLLGGLAVILLAVGITTATGLSLSSIATNTRLGVGGPYAIISRSLGLEIGGSVGVPLFISQALAVAMYIFGFREGWLWLFPGHPPLAVDLLTFALVTGIAYVSAAFAFKIQYAVMVVIGISVVLILASPAGWSGGEVVLLGDWRGSLEDGFAGTTFWGVFAVFFPAATGVMAGANMSGDLRDPRRSIPRGTLWAIGLSTLIYLALAVWAARAGTPEELTSSYTFLIDKSLWGPGVLLGLLGATLSSALSSLVGAPRILVALIRDRVLPDVGGLTQLSAGGEPRRALLASALLALGALLLRDLNVIAPLLSMFFLIAYCVINVVVFIESSLGLQSYRPTLRIPRVVPLLGAVGCVFAMFIVNPTVSLIAVGLVIGLYAFILKRGLTGEGDSRSGIFSAMAEWAATRATELEQGNPRAWKPNLLVPVVDPSGVRGDFHLLRGLIHPEGSLKLLGVATEDSVASVSARTEAVVREFRKEQLLASWSVIDSTDLRTGVVAGLQALRSAFFRPNVLFLDRAGLDDDALSSLWSASRRVSTGLVLLVRHPLAGLGKRSVIHLWIPRAVLGSTVQEGLDRAGLHLAVLLSLRLHRTWGAELRLVMAVSGADEVAASERWLADLVDRARIPASAQRTVIDGDLAAAVDILPQSDLDVMHLPQAPDLDYIREQVSVTRSACLFIGDSGHENALV